MKPRIRITERDLRNIIRHTLNEMGGDYRNDMRNAFKDKLLTRYSLDDGGANARFNDACERDSENNRRGVRYGAKQDDPVVGNKLAKRGENLHNDDYLAAKQRLKNGGANMKDVMQNRKGLQMQGYLPRKMEETIRRKVKEALMNEAWYNNGRDFGRAVRNGVVGGTAALATGAAALHGLDNQFKYEDEMNRQAAERNYPARYQEFCQQHNLDPDDEDSRVTYNDWVDQMNESQLHRVIKESLQEVLCEIGDTPKGQFALNAVRGRAAARPRYHNQEYNGVKTRAQQNAIVSQAGNMAWHARNNADPMRQNRDMDTYADAGYYYGYKKGMEN